MLCVLEVKSERVQHRRAAPRAEGDTKERKTAAIDRFPRKPAGSGFGQQDWPGKGKEAPLRTRKEDKVMQRQEDVTQKSAVQTLPCGTNLKSHEIPEINFFKGGAIS